MKAVVLAAGKGERLWPLTENRPKHLLPLAGKPAIIRTLNCLARSGIRDILLVVKYKADMIRASLGDGRQLGCRISFIPQRRLRGTADALRTCQGLLAHEDRFMVIYGDDFYAPSGVSRFVKEGLKTSDNLIGAAEVEDPSRFGALDMRNGLVFRIREKLTVAGPSRVNAGIYLLGKSTLKAVARTERSGRGEYELTDSLGLMIREGERVRGFYMRKDEWLGVTYPWDLLEANRIALENQPVMVAGELEDGVRVKGRVSLAKGSVVKSGSYLEGPVLIGEDSVVGPNSYVRPYTSIGNGCKVGASSEIKNSLLMDDVKVPHLSYVGDSVMGEGSSLGAGTVTANLRFDNATVWSKVRGKLVDSRRRKLGAILGDNVRTGINVSLYPGVKLGSAAWVGPGARVRDDVPSGGRVKS